MAKAVDLRITEKLVLCAPERAAILRRNTAIDDPAVARIFIGQIDLRGCVDIPAYGRVDPDAVAVDMVAEAVECLVDRV